MLSCLEVFLVVFWDVVGDAAPPSRQDGGLGVVWCCLEGGEIGVCVHVFVETEIV